MRVRELSDERLVEGDVTVLADTAHEEVDAAGLDDDAGLQMRIPSPDPALPSRILAFFRLMSTCLKQFVPHERVVARVLSKAHIFIHIERDRRF